MKKLEDEELYKKLNTIRTHLIVLLSQYQPYQYRRLIECLDILCDIMELDPNKNYESD